MFLLDTNIISELRRPKPHGGVAAWMDTLDDFMFCISAVSAGEIQQGIERVRPNDAAKALEIEAWLLGQLAITRVMPMDEHTFRIWATLAHNLPASLAIDAMIAATAIQHGLTLATRNARDFERFPVSLYDPFKFGK